MELEVGAVLDGKVTGITNFGAFVSLPGGRSGLVHISEIAYTFVNNVSELLSVGQDVKVKLIGIDDSGRINLSIKQTEPPPARGGANNRGRGPRPPRMEGRPQPSRPMQTQPRAGVMPQPRSAAGAPQESQDFDNMLKHFLSESESRQSELNRGGNAPRRPRRNRRG